MKRRRVLSALGLCALPLQARAADRKAPVALAAGAQYHEFALESADFQVVTFDATRCTLRVIDQPEASAARNLGMVMREQNAIAGVNAGFFTPEFQPLGLVISDGQRAGEWTRSTLLGGAVLVKNGRLMLLWREEVGSSDGVTQLVQAGPRLVNHGSAVTGLESSKHRARTFIATDGSGRWAIGLCQYTSLAGLASMLATPGLIPGLEIDRALNFDGGKSSGLWLRTASGEEVYEHEIATVRNFAGIFPRK